MSKGTAATKVRALLVAAGVKDIPETLIFRRTYAGANQRSEGAWSWYCTDADGLEYCGSQWPLGKLKPGSVDAEVTFLAYDLVPNDPKEK